MYYATNALKDNQINLPNKTNFDYMESDDEDYTEESYQAETPKYQKPREYNYQRYDHGLSLSNQPQQRESTLNYQEFRDVVFTEPFLKNYYNALQISLQEKEKIYAVFRFRGKTTEKHVQEQFKRLLYKVKNHNLIIKGSPILMRYNSPFAPGFIRRNEVAVEIENM